MAAFLSVDVLRAHAAPAYAYAALVQGAPAATEASLVHEIPGRLRFVVPAFKGNDHRAAALSVDLRCLQAVRNVQFNPLTGSLLVAYDGLDVVRDAIFQALDASGYRVPRQMACRRGERGTACVPGPRGAAALAIKAILHCVLDLALESAIAAVV